MLYASRQKINFKVRLYRSCIVTCKLTCPFQPWYCPFLFHDMMGLSDGWVTVNSSWLSLHLKSWLTGKIWCWGRGRQEEGWDEMVGWHHHYRTWFGQLQEVSAGAHGARHDCSMSKQQDTCLEGNSENYMLSLLWSACQQTFTSPTPIPWLNKLGFQQAVNAPAPLGPTDVYHLSVAHHVWAPSLPELIIWAPTSLSLVSQPVGWCQSSLFLKGLREGASAWSQPPCCKRWHLPAFSKKIWV